MPFRGSLQDIRLFVAAYEEKSFTAAAAREFSTQSGVSHHIRQLENLLGVKLFVREKSGVTATPVADIFYRRCVEVMRSINEAADQVDRYKEGYQGSFSLGIIPALCHRIAAPALLQFSESNPNVKVRIVENYSSSMAELVASGEIDFAISTLHGGESGVDATSLFSIPECLVERAQGDEAARRLGALQPINMVWARGMEARRAAINASLIANGIMIDQSAEIDSALATLDLVSRSDWKTVTPALMIDPEADRGRFTIAPLNDPDVIFSVMLLTLPSLKLSPEASAFVDIFCNVANAALQRWGEVFDQLS